MKKSCLALNWSLLAAALLLGCVAKETETGGNTSWVRCTTQADCRGDEICANDTERCEPAPVPARDAGKTLAPSEPDARSEPELNPDCTACLASGGQWEPDGQGRCVDECLADGWCYVDECPLVCTSDSCSCFSEAACENVGCEWFTVTSGDVLGAWCAAAGSQPAADAGNDGADGGDSGGAQDASSNASGADASEPAGPGLDADCTACLASGGKWSPGEENECLAECYEDSTCFIDECPAACTADSCSCFSKTACENVGCEWLTDNTQFFPLAWCAATGSQPASDASVPVDAATEEADADASR